LHFLWIIDAAAQFVVVRPTKGMERNKESTTKQGSANLREMGRRILAGLQLGAFIGLFGRRILRSTIWFLAITVFAGACAGAAW